MSLLFRLFYWPIKETVKFCLILCALLYFTSFGSYVNPNQATAGLVHVARIAWGTVHRVALNISDHVRRALPASPVSANASGNQTTDSGQDQNNRTDKMAQGGGRFRAPGRG